MSDKNINEGGKVIPDLVEILVVDNFDMNKPVGLLKINEDLVGKLHNFVLSPAVYKKGEEREVVCFGLVDMPESFKKTCE